MLNTQFDEPNCIKYWSKKNIISNDWNSIFHFKIKNRTINKIGHFQYNLLNNLICCKRNLWKWSLSESERCTVCDCLDDYDHFFIKCKFNKSFWIMFSNYMRYLFNGSNFNITLEKVICGWNIQNSDFYFANKLIEIATFAVYKSRLIFYDTKKVIPISILFMYEIKKIDQIISFSNRRVKVTIEKKDLENCKIYWNIK